MLGDEFWQLVEDIFPDGTSDTIINDYLWFDEDSYIDMLGIDIEDWENA